MGDSKEAEDDDGEKEGEKDDRFFIEGSSSSDNELGLGVSRVQHSSKPKRWTGRAQEIPSDYCPPLVLAFSLLTGRAAWDSSCSSLGPLPGRDQDLEDSDGSVEEWMILGGEKQDGDSDIQLNLGYWSSGCSDDAEDDGQTQQAADQLWAVSYKDKEGTVQPVAWRYFTPDPSLACRNCNKTGHLAKRCPNPKKRPVCVLCGLQGHLQKGCPSHHCSSCGLPRHGSRPCSEPSVWHQHCLRCGATGHLSDACPDTWRQYHLTECASARMAGAARPSVPYVCRYDTREDALRRRAWRKSAATEHPALIPSLLSECQSSSKSAPGGSGEEDCPVRGVASGRRQRPTRDADGREARRKTWPERRRERREVKRLRRAAQGAPDDTPEGLRR